MSHSSMRIWHNPFDMIRDMSLVSGPATFTALELVNLGQVSRSYLGFGDGVRVWWISLANVRKALRRFTEEDLKQARQLSREGRQHEVECSSLLAVYLQERSGRKQIASALTQFTRRPL